ncbi:hypothetical protein HII13_001510 [Brettanomyces bruxellensis]|uniref:Conserved oligomeric Golgi complex subunit 2 n=1 Tax=Dekkera bruxellensis TaxID=5007 RepID=A0A7D9H2P3_DEKBR|nr:hypothetical protein HII13_001510 [Brettanomyces bruxellensis]VUG18604.1 DEBR0S3_15588g1_1 [Brettanomyces bruxellensis]
MDEVEKAIRNPPSDTLSISPRHSLSRSKESSERPDEELETLSSEDSDGSSDEEFAFASKNLTRETISKCMSDLGMDNISDMDESKLLLKYFRYWSLDDLSKNLTGLLKDVNSDLVELVNDNYMKFISLGNSLDGCSDSANDVKIEVLNYRQKLQAENSNIISDLNMTDGVLGYKRQLTMYQHAIKLLIVLNEQTETFGRLCKGEQTEKRIRHIVALYISMNKQYSGLVKMMNDTGNGIKVLKSSEMMRTLSRRMNALRMEFRSLIETQMESLRTSGKTHEDNVHIFELLKLYQVAVESEKEYAQGN